MRCVHLARGLVTAAALGWAAASVGQTAWPAFMPQLQAGPSESATKAALPDGVKIEPPDASLAPARARWSGLWHGWACFARQCDVNIAIEKVSAEGATLAYAGVNAQGQIQDRGEARFVGEELQTRLRNGNALALRLRESGDMEMALSKPDGTVLWAGVLTQKPFRYERELSRIPTPWAENGKPLTLELVSYRPLGKGPFPTLIFNHGSTGAGNRPAWFTLTWTSPEVAQYFTDKGWQVLMPQRRGRGKSDGLYDEGFERDRSRYACAAELSLPGMDRAVADLDAVLAHVKTRPDVDNSRLLIGGVSRGGILSVVYAGTRPGDFEGVVNFVGGWLGEACADAARVNTVLFQRGAAFKKPQLWLYGEQDPYYSLAHSRKNLEAFVAAGGNASFVSYAPPPGRDGHSIYGSPALWTGDLDGYLKQVDGR